MVEIYLQFLFENVENYLENTTFTPSLHNVMMKTNERFEERI